MINTNNEKEIIPDSLELEVAYWESFRSEWPMEQYMARVPLCNVASSHHRSVASLIEFFSRKYGKDWRKMRPSDYMMSYCTKRKRSSIRDEQIVSLLAEGWRIREIAKSLDTNYAMIQTRIKRGNLREVANNDNYKPAYAAA